MEGRRDPLRLSERSQRTLARKALGLAAAGMAAVALLTSCSWSTAFALSNRSDSPIELAYSLRWIAAPAEDNCRGPESTRPVEASASEIRWWRAVPRWRELEPSAYLFDEAACVFRLTIQPGRSVAIFQTPTYVGQTDEFLVGWLEVSIPGKRPMRFVREQLLALFEKRGDLVYELSVDDEGLPGADPPGRSGL